MTLRRSCNISILIANANAMATELISNALGKQSRFTVTACCCTSEDTVGKYQSTEPDIALIGTTLHDGPYSGFAALRKIRTLDSGAKAIMLLDSDDHHLVIDAFRAGARGVFCTSQSEFKTLCKCIVKVHEGQVWAKSNELSYVLDTFSQMASLRVVDTTGIDLLSKREEEAVRLLAQGLTNREIAHEMKLSEHTVKNYMFRIFDKLGVSTRVELVLYAVSASKRVEELKVEPSSAPSESIVRVV